MASNHSQFISSLAEHISMPEVYTDIRQLIRNPEARVEDFIKVIELDSMLTVRILRIANSAFFGFSHKVTTLKRALNLIGIIQLHDLLLCSLCIRTFSSVPKEIINLKQFWLYSVQCGIAAKVIAQYSFIPISNHFFTLGLLHEIGHAAMYIKEPELSFKALEESQMSGRSIQQLEQELLGFDYGQIGSELMRLWQLPKVYQQVTDFSLHPVDGSDGRGYEIEIVNLAHTICQNLNAGVHGEIIEKARDSCDKLKNLSSNIDGLIIKEIEEHADTVLDMLWPVGTDHLPKKGLKHD